MQCLTYKEKIHTKGFCDIIDITDKVTALLNDSNLQKGNITVFINGATASVTTIEYEEGALQDLKDLFEKIIPQNEEYRHNLRWHDGNGFSHVRASLLGPSISVPFTDGNLLKGTWQQIILIDFDNRPRNREFIIQLIGE